MHLRQWHVTTDNRHLGSLIISMVELMSSDLKYRFRIWEEVWEFYGRTWLATRGGVGEPEEVWLIR